jgi:tripeptidyl-peptidase II
VAIVADDGQYCWLGPGRCGAGDFRLGVKRGFELFPRELADRVKRNRRKKMETDTLALKQQVYARLTDFDAGIKKREPSAVERKQRRDIELQLELLDENLKSFEDPGPVYDWYSLAVPWSRSAFFRCSR